MAKYVEGPYSDATPFPLYDREPVYDKMIWDRDVMIPMRDGVRICCDIYRPDAEGKFPALLAFAPHNKDMQTPHATEDFAPQPAWSPFWVGQQEAGDSRFFTSRGYVHINGNPRGTGKSEDGGEIEDPWVGSHWDLYDLIEWIAVQPWCDGDVGMIGISAFGGNQFFAASLNPPHLKALFPYDPMACYGDGLLGFRDHHPGGVLQLLIFFLDPSGVAHIKRGQPPELPPEIDKLWQAAINNPDYKMYRNMYNILTQKGQHQPYFFNLLLNPYDTLEQVERTEDIFKKIKVPFYTGSGWYAYTYKLHLQGSQNWYAGVESDKKKLMFTGPAHVPRPWVAFHGEVLRWYDYWLKGIDTGIMDEPPVKYWVMGANKWRTGDNWPLPETQWTKLYLYSWERLRLTPFVPNSRDGICDPDAFVQMPLTQTRKVSKLRYMTDPLPNDTLVAGPISLKLYASIDQEDTNWIIILKDVGPDNSVRTAREGELEIPELPERELTRGWLKASLKAIDEKRTKPWKPWHYLTKEARKPIVPGEINEYDIEILSTANLFKAGHRICLEISSLDMPTGSSNGFHNVEYIPYHICSSKTVLHKIYHDGEHPSYLLLPIIPTDQDDK